MKNLFMKTMSHFIKLKKGITRNFTTKNNHPLTQAVFTIIGTVLGRARPIPCST